MEIKLSLNSLANENYASIPENISIINSTDKLKEIVERIGKMRYSWSPAIFRNGQISIEAFEQMQLFALDFNCGIKWEEVKQRADEYNLPILFAYEMLTSINHNKFQVVFLNDILISDKCVAEMILKALRIIFPESDPHCKEAMRIISGGKDLFYFDNKIPQINIEMLIMNMELYLKDIYGDNNYGRNIKKFAKDTGLSLKNPTTLDISVYHSEEDFKSEEISLNAIYIKGNREKSSKIYRLYFADNEFNIENNVRKNHKSCQVAPNSIGQHCQLLQDFSKGTSWLYNEQLFGLATNLVNVEGGRKFFLDNLKKVGQEYADYYSYPKKHREFGTHYFSYLSNNDYSPMRCDCYCPYANSCRHGANIIETVQLKRGTIVEIANSKRVCISTNESEDKLLDAIKQSMNNRDFSIHLIIADLGLGKTTMMLEYLKNIDPNFEPCAIAFPDNNIKNEKYAQAVKMGIPAMTTPSLYEIREDIPIEIWKVIQKYYEAGGYIMVNKYIQKVAEEQNIQALKDFIKKEKEWKNFKGFIFTTHNKMLRSHKSFGKYKKIIDEDIMNTFITGQISIKVSDLERLLKESPFRYKKANDKIAKAIEYSKTVKSSKFFELPRINYYMYEDEYEDMPIGFDISSFCQAEIFCSLKQPSPDGHFKNSSDDSIFFLRPLELFRDKSFGSEYIIMSATANKELYKKVFGKDNIKIHDCESVENKGNQYQFPDMSMSRSFIKKNPDTYNKVRKIIKDFEYQKNPNMSIDKIIEKVNNMPIITFKMFKDKISDAKYWYGNAAGTNSHEGQDIIVVGTPHIPEIVYKMLGRTLGYNFNEDAGLRCQKVEHNGYKFEFYTYDDKVLRDIQFWLIESAMKQVVGRARLKRNDCNVYLFSDFILEQSQIIY